MSQHEAIFDALKAEISTENAGLLPADSIRFGGKETHRQNAPPEILVIPSPEEEWEAPEQIGGQTYLAGSDELRVSRCIYTLRGSWEVRFWGRTRDEVEQLRKAFVLAALSANGVGDVLRPLRGNWTTDDADAGDIVDGAQYNLTVSLALSVTDDPPEIAVTPPSTAVVVGSTENPDGYRHTGSLVIGDAPGEVGCGG